MLHALLTKVSVRTLGVSSLEEVGRLPKLPGGDPAVIAFEAKVMADRVVFGLGRIKRAPNCATGPFRSAGASAASRNKQQLDTTARGTIESFRHPNSPRST